MTCGCITNKRTMNEKKITILGEEITIKFNMAVELAYEEIAQKPFDLKELKSQKESLALYIAAIITSNPDSKITFERLVNEATGPEIALLQKTVIEAMTEWLQIPAVEPVNEAPTEGEQPKN